MIIGLRHKQNSGRGLIIGGQVPNGIKMASHTFIFFFFKGTCGVMFQEESFFFFFFFMHDNDLSDLVRKTNE